MSWIKKKALLNSITQNRTLPITPTPTNKQTSSKETTPLAATPLAAAPRVLPQNTAEESSWPPRQSQQNPNQFQNIDQFRNQLKIAVIDRGHPYGQIDCSNENLVVNAIAECMLTMMNSNYYIAPR